MSIRVRFRCTTDSCGARIAELVEHPDGGLVFRDLGRQFFFRSGWRRAITEQWLPDGTGMSAPDPLLLEAPDPVFVHCDGRGCGQRYEISQRTLRGLAAQSAHDGVTVWHSLHR